MNPDLPKVSRTARAAAISRSTRFPYLLIATGLPAGALMPWSWLPFLSAAEELASALPGVEQREIELLLFKGTPFVTDDFIYIPQNIILNLQASAVRHGLIEPPKDEDEGWGDLADFMWEPA